VAWNVNTLFMRMYNIYVFCLYVGEGVCFSLPCIDVVCVLLACRYIIAFSPCLCS
jgi:hypothetical protein